MLIFTDFDRICEIFALLVNPQKSRGKNGIEADLFSFAWEGSWTKMGYGDGKH